jgi:hypothetical protein
VLGFAWPAGAAAPFDGSVPLICASIQSFECDPDQDVCDEGDADDVVAPDFMRIDFEKKQLISLDEDHRGQITSIGSVQKLEDGVILQGSEGGRGWTLRLTDSGQTVMTVSDPLAAFVIFGSCTKP